MNFLRFLMTNHWPILSAAASLYFLWVFHEHVGYPPSEPLTPTSALYLALFVLFLLAPFVQRFRLGRLMEFETEVEEVRSDMKEVRTETRELILTVSAKEKNPMQVSEIYDTLRNRFVEIQIYRSVVKDSTKEELKRLSEYIEQLSNFEDSAIPFLSMQSMYFQELSTGEVVRYGFIESSADDQRIRTSRHKNRQYGWLLVEAYEEFEDFLERIYAYIGKNRRNAWYLEDFGRAKLPELDAKPFLIPTQAKRNLSSRSGIGGVLSAT